MKILQIILTAVVALLLSSCVASTYWLTPQQQEIAREKYPVEPGLNLVEGEPVWNTAKVAARVVLAPVTLFISEGMLCGKRELPYKLYFSELSGIAKAQAGASLVDFDTIVEIGDLQAYLDQESADAAKTALYPYNAMQQEFWTTKYALGQAAIQKICLQYGFCTVDEIQNVQSNQESNYHNIRILIQATLSRIKAERMEEDRRRRLWEEEMDRKRMMHDFHHHHHHDAPPPPPHHKH
ncbi:MAG: hypothetical protein MJ106_03360 [Lentisphaeria bacterium]|nr:hypothetical protein [Lentisphaeria bacterium]